MSQPQISHVDHGIVLCRPRQILHERIDTYVSNELEPWDAIDINNPPTIGSISVESYQWLDVQI